MRLPRIKLHGKTVVYHCMSRIVGKEPLLDQLCKYKLSALIKKVCRFCGMELITWCVMNNHLHVLVRVPETQNPTDKELIKRMEKLYGKRGTLVQLAREGLERTGKVPADIRDKMLKRMGDISVLMKEIKQRFSRWYNKRMDRPGTLWAERFRSVVVEDSLSSILRVACYIDLNPVRAGIVRDPKDYRFSGYGAAMRGDQTSREGLMGLMGGRKWGQTARMYRMALYLRGREAGQSGKVVLEDAEIKRVMDACGGIGLGEVLLMRIRHMTDGVAFGSREFVEEVFRQYRDKFGPKRKTGARPIRGVNLGEVYVLRDLRVNAVE